MKNEKGSGRNLSRREFILASAAAGLAMPLSAHAKGPVAKRRPLCIFSKHLQWCESFDQMAEMAYEAGFDGIDLTVRPGGHIEPERAMDDLPKAVEAVRRAELDVPMLTTSITDADEPYTEGILKTASKLGIRYYRMGYLSYDDPDDIVGSLERNQPKMARLAEINRKYEIHGAYQNHAGTRVGGPVWDLWFLLKDLDPQWIGCQYDVRHATVEGGTSWPLGMSLLKDYIKITAIKDVIWKQGPSKWAPENVPLGQGMVDFQRYWPLIAKYQIAGPISLHFEYDLGGAEHGRDQISIGVSQFLACMKSDLSQLKIWTGALNP